MVYPKILHGVEMYAYTHITYLKDLMVTNNKILRILQKKPLKSKIDDLYITYDTLPVDKLYKFQMLQFIHKFKYNNSFLPIPLQNVLKLNKSIHTYDTRQQLDIHRELYKYNFGFRCLNTQCVQLWNIIPVMLKVEMPRSTFREMIKRFLQDHSLI